MIVICFSQSFLRDCFFEEHYDAIMKTALSIFKTRGLQLWECISKCQCNLLWHKEFFFLVDKCTTSIVYGKLNRKLLILYLRILYLASICSANASIKLYPMATPSGILAPCLPAELISPRELTLALQGKQFSLIWKNLVW